MKIKFHIIILFGLLSLNNFAQEADTSQAKTIAVYGDGFVYSVKQPSGWIGDTAMAHNYYANIVFYEDEAQEDLVYGKTIIQVYNFKKEDKKIREEFNNDLSTYREQYKKLQEEDFTVGNREYTCYSKLVFIKDSLYQYLVYMDPGKKFKSAFSVSMNTPKRSTDNQFKAFRKIISSIRMIKDN